MSRSTINSKLLTQDILGPILKSVPKQTEWGKIYSPHQSQVQSEVPKIGQFAADQLEKKHPEEKYVKATAKFIRIASAKGLITVEVCSSGVDASLHPSIDPEVDLDALAHDCGFKVAYPGRKAN